VKWAIENHVDIISLSWGLPKEVEGIKKALKLANSKGIIALAAAGNEGLNRNISFPASMDGVFCIGATDGLGNRRKFSAWDPDVEMYATLGEAVSGARDTHKPCACLKPCLSHQRKDGTSAATPVAAGIAALFIEYSRSFDDNGYEAGSPENMRKLFLEMSKDASPGSMYRYLTPWRISPTDDRPKFREAVQRIIKNPLCLRSPHKSVNP
jgi:subtilisin family serine protease